MTTLTRNEHHLRMLQIIAEREGSEMATAHEAEKTMVELENHFEANYTIFDNDIEPCYVIESALEQLNEHDFYDLVSRNKHETTDIYQTLEKEGFLTQVSNVHVLSFKYPWLKEQ